MFGCFHNCAFVKIRKEYPLQARRVMHAIWGAGQMAWTKFIVVVDDDVDVHDEKAVLRPCSGNCHFGRDIEIVNGPLDILDHAAPRLGAGHKIGFDATRKIAGEEVNGIAMAHERRLALTPTDCNPWASRDHAWPFLISAPVDASSSRWTRPRWPGRSRDPVVVARCSVGLSRIHHRCDSTSILRDWRRCSSISAPTAIPVAICTARTHRRRPSGRIAFDATRKMPGDERHGQPVRDYPPPMVMDDATEALVTRRWQEYGL